MPRADLEGFDDGGEGGRSGVSSLIGAGWLYRRRASDPRPVMLPGRTSTRAEAQGSRRRGLRVADSVLPSRGTQKQQVANRITNNREPLTHPDENPEKYKLSLHSRQL